MQRFGQKLYYLRTRRRMTLRQLAEALGYSSHTRLSELESGKKKPAVEFALSIARFFNVTTDELLKDELDLNVDD